VVAQDPVAAGIVSDAVGLLGLGDSAIRPFPFAELVDNPNAVQQWLTDLFAAGGATPVRAWLQHFAGLFRSLFGVAPVAQFPPNGYRLYVDPNFEGFRPATDYVAAPSKTFSTGVNGYRIRALGDWDATIDHNYVGRTPKKTDETASLHVPLRGPRFVQWL